jgi:RNase P/RNase MRP subunit p29
LKCLLYNSNIRALCVRLQALEQRAKVSEEKPTVASERQGPSTSGASDPTANLESNCLTANEAGDVYSPLHEDFFSGSAAQLLQLTGITANGTDIIDIISEAFSDHTQIHELKRKFDNNVQDKALLLDNPTSIQKRPKNLTSGEQRFTRKLFSRKQQKALGVYDLREDKLTFNGLIPLHNRWKEYINAVITPAEDRKELLRRVYTADLHGCLIRVSESKEDRYRKINGIVARDSTTSFHIVTRDDRLVIVPKKHNVFEFLLTPKQVIVLLGNGLVSGKKGVTSQKVS